MVQSRYFNLKKKTPIKEILTPNKLNHIDLDSLVERRVLEGKGPSTGKDIKKRLYENYVIGFTQQRIK